MAAFDPKQTSGGSAETLFAVLVAKRWAKAACPVGGPHRGGLLIAVSNAKPTRLEIATAIALAVGGIGGMAGSFAPAASVRQALWAIDGVSLICAASLLTVKYLRRGEDILASGFLIFTVGETLVLSGTAAGLTASVPSFAAGISLWAAALVLLGLPRAFPIWGRAAGFIAAVLFAVSAARIFWGEVLLPTAVPLPTLGYPFLVVSLAGWITRQIWPERP
jgi:hypothetical protein